MRPVQIILYIIVIFVMLLLSAFFSGSEISFNASNKTRLKKSADEKVRGARLAYYITEKFTTALCAILVGNNLANIAASTCATALFIDLFYRLFKTQGYSGIASTVSTIIMTVIVLIFGEIVPKILCKKHADKLVLVLALPVRILTIILYPVVVIIMGLMWILRKIWGKDSEGTPAVTEDELSTIIDTVEEEGVINEDQSELLQSSLEFKDTTIEEIMTPRIDLITIDINDDKEAIIATIETSTYSRIPVYDDTIDDIIGVLHLNHYFKEVVDNPDIDIRKMLRAPLFLHKTMKLPMALRRLREKKTHLAIVIDEFGGTLGVVTIEDILEEIVGDIWDESDDIIPDIIERPDGRYEVNGDMNIDDFFAAIDFEPPEDFECQYSTVGGFAIENLNSDPKVGQYFDYDRLRVLVSDMEDKVRVTKLFVTVNPPKKNEEEDEGIFARKRKDEDEGQ